MAKKNKIEGVDMSLEAHEPLGEDPVFGAEPFADEPPPRISALFQPSPADLAADDRRKHDRKIGLLVGPKNLERLRAFGYDVAYVSSDSLAPGVAHRGLTE